VLVCEAVSNVPSVGVAPGADWVKHLGHGRRRSGAARKKGRFPVSVDISRLVPHEHSEVTREFATQEGLSYAALCARQALAPSPGEWGVLHCTAGPERTRITLATSDMSYHRLLIQAFNGPRDPADTSLAPSWSSRYTYGRYGWPDDWDPDSPGDPIPWLPVGDGGLREVGRAHAFLFSHTGPQTIEVSFQETSGGSRWSMLDVERFSLPAGYGDLFVVDPDQARIDWIAARGVFSGGVVHSRSGGTALPKPCSPTRTLKRSEW
jgi:hypothetical protein